MRGRPRLRGLAGLSLLVLLSLAACRTGPLPSPEPDRSGVPSAGPTHTGAPPPTGGFSIGVEYGVPGLAGMAASTGAMRAKPALEFGVWGNIEPRPGEREWRPLDTLVAEYQAAGFRDLQLLISADSPWAARTPRRDPMPRDEFLDEYAAFVTAFVERYDGDGLDDAPGLRFPVHEYGVEREFTGFWGSSADDYLRLLALAAPAIRAADTEATVILVAIMAIDVFDGAPTAEEVERRWATDRPFRKSRADTVAILGACADYDAVDVHGLGDATELPPTLDWIRARLLEAGCPAKPIWIGDAFPMSPLRAFDARPIHPAIREDLEAVSVALEAAVDPAHPGHEVNLKSLRAEMARGIVRKLALAAAAGAAGINVGNLEDWTTGLVPADRLLVLAAGTSILGGIADTRVTLRQPGGPLPYEGSGFSRERVVEALRPAHAALSMVVPLLDGATRAERLDVGDAAAWVIRLETPAGIVFVAWADDGRLHRGTDEGPSLGAMIEFPAGAVRLARVPIADGELVRWEPISAADGRLELSLELTPMVLVVEPD